MKFGEIPIDAAEGAILAHAHRDGGLNFAKGRRLSADDVGKLKSAGITRVVGATLDPEDVHEDEAARAIALAAGGGGLTPTAPFTGRANLFASAAGIATVDVARIDALNALNEAITIATLPAFAVVTPKQMVATIKIIPFAAPRTAVQRALDLIGSTPLVAVAAFQPLKAGLVQTSLPGTRAKVLDKAVETTRARMMGIGGTLQGERRVAHDEAAIARAIEELKAEGCDLFLVAGASAIVDRRDTVPAGIEAAGGRINHFGMPVDPGNLLLMGEIDGAPAIGLPGCAKSPKFNGFDYVLQRLAARLPVGPREVMGMGVGGLLAETTSRGVPRAATSAKEESQAAEAPPRAPRIAALVLAAGRSSRMGGPNKLLAEIDGMPMVARAVAAALASQAVSVTVVLGHMAAEVKAAVASLGASADKVRFAENPDFADGLSASLRAGLGALPADVDGVLVCLGDMPAVSSAQLDRLIAAFNPVEGRSICVPTVGGKRGNPVLWDRRFFAEMTGVSGDSGAKHLIGEHADLVCEVEMGSEGVLIDLDTPEALAAFRARATEAA
ncbi:4-diphosphocytidyl-2C-methyl-D-erythritol kinase [Vineibacter terrae]|uniref:4-diphosphocytidyl-2C-methyl-D-erythritol kinase n=1 Tax=Vineibacter terrae TaxID=2586908 RepID=A0A5C8PHZ6_9HYPH|nr:molybdopterin-binding/glycosyltransferase family 2 protein [Vineibacter terrae]TXL72968.1 4-diphosphocytidyl-2C-methyl-D-erythritol kinase [Vineibacter terrae]